MRDQLQFDFDFDAPPPEKTGDGDTSAPGDGLDTWRRQRKAQLNEMAANLGLPLGHEVELTLSTGPTLRGKLRLAEEKLWVEEEKRSRAFQLILRIGKAEFPASEVESCVRLDV